MIFAYENIRNENSKVGGSIIKMKRTMLIDIKDRVEKKRIRESRAWAIWSGFMNRVNSKNEAYKNSTSCEEWYNFYTFEKDYPNIINYQHIIDYPDLKWQLDKDIRSHGNGMYSLNTCCFVPPVLNGFFANNYNGRNCELPGLHIHVGTYGDKSYNASVSMYGKSINLYSHKTQLSAYNAYVAKKWEILHVYLNDLPMLSDEFRAICEEKFYAQYVEQIEKNAHIL